MDILLANQEMVKVNGLRETAEQMGMSTASLHARMYGIKGSVLRVDQELALQFVSGTKLFAQAVAAQSGGVFVELPSAMDLSGADLEDTFHELHEETGRLSHTFREAKKDNEIDDRERADLEAIYQSMHKTAQKLQALMFLVYCRNQVAA